MNNPKESVWDYPRPPRLEPTQRRIRILHQGQPLADTHAALRILETSHPPVYYLPPTAFAPGLLQPSSSRQSFCEFKGLATYWTLHLSGLDIPDAAWSYERPSAPYAALRSHVAFYASRLAAHGIACYVDDEPIQAQPGDFYGGWITSDLTGPFKGPPGTRNW